MSLLRCEDKVFGAVASDPMVCRLVNALAEDIEAVEGAVNRAHKVARQRAWALAGQDAPPLGSARRVR